jgi:hypothetical protein
MTITATHTEHHNTSARTLLMAVELSGKTWKLGFTTGHGQKPRERTVTARDQACVLDEIASAKRRLGLPETAAVVSCYEAGRPVKMPGLPSKPSDRWGRLLNGEINTKCQNPSRYPCLRAIGSTVHSRTTEGLTLLQLPPSQSSCESLSCRSSDALSAETSACRHRLRGAPASRCRRAPRR